MNCPYCQKYPGQMFNGWAWQTCICRGAVDYGAHYGPMGTRPQPQRYDEQSPAEESRRDGIL